MPDEITQQQAELRISDAERERVVGWLHAAVTEGRLTLGEFSDRVQGVLAAKTYAEVQQYVRDLPPAGAPSALVAADPVELVARGDHLYRFGNWAVPQRMAVRAREDGHVELDFTEAVIRYPVVEVDIDCSWGSCKLLLPKGATADISGVTRSFLGRASCRLPDDEASATAPRFVVRGRVKFGGLKVRRGRSKS